MRAGALQVLSPGGTADFVLQRECDFLFFVKPELEMRRWAWSQKECGGGGEGAFSFSPFPVEFSFAPLRMLFLVFHRFLNKEIQSRVP